MLCKSPFMIGPLPCPCQRCMPCRVNKKRLWTFRLELEAKKHIESCVATLTYNDLNLPEGGQLVPSHAQKWIRSLRKVYAPKKIRYFLVGEYGENTLRPHYHVVLFGVSAAVAGGIDRWSGLVKKTWKYGNVFVDGCSSESISYIAGYVTKKLTKNDRELKGLPPEFTRMSLRPGIGAGAAKDISKVLCTDAGLGYLKETGDVPFSLRYGSKTVPIGRYLRGLLREKLKIGCMDSRGLLRGTPLIRQKAYWQEMWALRKKAENDPRRKATSFKDYLVDTNAQKILNMETRLKIQPTRRKL